MRCDEVTRKLEAHGGSRDDQAVADHLAVCQACARRALQADRLQWLWDVTCAPEPTTETWERLWSSVTTRLDQTDLAKRDRPWPSQVTVTAAPPRPGQDRLAGRGMSRRAPLPVLILSQVAAILLALGWYFHVRPRAPEPYLAPGPDLVIDIEEGQVPLVRLNGSKSEISDLSSLQPYNGEDPWLVFLNDVESASTAVVMTE
ncbi:MAG TPA: hypothetical protein VJY33_01780 [Isosphaeraceae bacterium]|nr:hypothetical protein [Isosphaeraceae bacterium]